MGWLDGVRLRKNAGSDDPEAGLPGTPHGTPHQKDALVKDDSRNHFRAAASALLVTNFDGFDPGASFVSLQDEPVEEAAPVDKGHGHAHLGTIAGVVIPTCENMWGVLIFLRFFYIVGNAGVLQSFIIVGICALLAYLTVLSLAATATNGRIKHGGAYFLISRALGPKIGGSIGFMYFLGITLLAVLETLGAVEVLLYIAPALNFPGCVRILGAALVLIMGVWVFCGIKFVSKLGIVFALIVLYSLTSLYLGLFISPHGDVPPTVTGLSWTTFKSNWGAGYTGGETFSSMLTLFFPCVTGLLSGADRATNLKDPSRSIPKGTLIALTLSTVMYTTYMGFWGAVATRTFLLYGPETAPPPPAMHRLLRHMRHLLSGGGEGGSNLSAQIVGMIAWPNELAMQIGIIVASISQALQCLIVAPKLLQAMGADGSLPFAKRLSKLSGGEPRRALIVTVILAMLGCMIGSLDAVAPLVSICFLQCYASLNISCAVLSILRAPSWRPTWKYFHWSLALFGSIGCLVLMWFIKWYYALIAMLAVFLLWLYIDYQQVQADWGTGLGGLLLQLALNSIWSLGKELQYTVNWRPQLLCLLGPEYSDPIMGATPDQVLHFTAQLKKGQGLCMVATIAKGNLTKEGENIHLLNLFTEKVLKKAKLKAFSTTVMAPSFREGKTYAIQCAGLGALTPNTVLLDWPQHWQEEGREEDAEIMVELLRECTASGKGLISPRGLENWPAPSDNVEGYIDIWWIVHDGGMLVLLSYILLRDRTWRRCKLRIITVAESVDDPVEIKMNVQKLLVQAHIQAEVEVVTLEEGDLNPYTFDLTLRVEEAEAFQRKLEEARHGSRVEEPAEIEGQGSTLWERIHGSQSEATPQASQPTPVAAASGPSRASVAAKEKEGEKKHDKNIFPATLATVANKVRARSSAIVSRASALHHSIQSFKLDHASQNAGIESIVAQKWGGGERTIEKALERQKTLEASSRDTSVRSAASASRMDFLSVAALDSSVRAAQPPAQLEPESAPSAQFPRVTPVSKPPEPAADPEKEPLISAMPESSQSDSHPVETPAQPTTAEAKGKPATISEEELDKDEGYGTATSDAASKGEPATHDSTSEIVPSDGDAEGSPTGENGAAEESKPLTGSRRHKSDCSCSDCKMTESFAGADPGDTLVEARALGLLDRDWGDIRTRHDGDNLNRQIVALSYNSPLVLINLPDAGSHTSGRDYVQYCEDMVKGLGRVIFVHGTGKEVWRLGE